MTLFLSMVVFTACSTDDSNEGSYSAVGAGSDADVVATLDASLGTGDLMTFTITPDATTAETFAAYDAGDVVLGPNNKEYVYNKGINAASSEWIELGDEGSYALKSSTDTITEVNTFTANTLPQLTVTSVSIPNVTDVGSTPSLTVTETSIPNVTAAGSATTASVAQGVLNITIGAPPTLGTAISVGSASGWNAGSTPTLGTNISVGSASDWSAGTQASLTTNDTTVVVPGTAI